MKIAFLHNLQTCLTPEQAEFDTPETVEAVRAALCELGHKVTLVEASTSLPSLVARLEALRPDLVFNTAEGSRGRFREGFYPALLEQLGLAFTGSDAYVCTLTLDKHLTKLALKERGIKVPGWKFVSRGSELKDLDLTFPVIVKPNFEGSSKGITQDSVVEAPERLEAVVTAMLEEYPSGVLVEEFIRGRDVTVPYLSKKGVLEPAHYVFKGPARKHSIYDYELKQHRPDDVEVACPAEVSPATRKRLVAATRKAVEVLQVKDFARVDFRVDERGEAFLIEVNALPSLEPGAAIYLCAAAAGLPTVGSVLDCIVKSACNRQQIIKEQPKTQPTRVGLTYNVKRSKVSEDQDHEAEFDSPTTIHALLEAIRANGYEPIDLEAGPELPARLEGVDVVFNIAEGIQGRNREAQVPALLELMGIPFTGSDAGALALALDKALAKRLVRQAGFHTPDFLVMNHGREKLPNDLRYPLFVKPVAEGSSKGIFENCLVENEKQLREAVIESVARYHQPALVETYLPGREFTVGILGQRKLRMLPPMEILFGPNNTKRVYAFSHKLDENENVTFQVPAEVTPKLFRQLEKVAKGAFRALGCRDVARIDLRCDGEGNPHFLECNPLPGLTPNFSDLCVIARAAGLSYTELVAEILTPAIKRWKNQRREQQHLATTGA